MSEKPKGSGGGPPGSAKPSAAAVEWKARPCPICGKPGAFQTRPFCSKRCADIDLHRWLGGTYAIPAVEDDGPEDEPSGEP